MPQRLRRDPLARVLGLQMTDLMPDDRRKLSLAPRHPEHALKYPDLSAG